MAKHTARFKRLYEVALNMGMSNADASYYAARIIEYECMCVNQTHAKAKE